MVVYLFGRKDYTRKDSEAEVRTRLPTMVAVGQKHAREMADAMDTYEDLPASQEKRRRVEDPHVAFVAEKEVVQEHAKRRGPEKKNHWDATHASPLGRSGCCNSSLGGRSVS